MANKQSFLVHIIKAEHATWQGSITWLDQEKTEYFRSMLEMIKLMDATVEPEEPAQAG